MGSQSFSTQDLTKIGIMAALAAVCTTISIPFTLTGGYFNLGDIIVVTSALLFGPIIGGLSGGIGSAIADIYLGYGYFAPYTLVVKGLEGFVVGYIGGRSENTPNTQIIIAWIIGGLIIIAGYWIAEVVFLGLSAEYATAEALTINILQAIFSVIGIPLAKTVRKRITV